MKKFYFSFADGTQAAMTGIQFSSVATTINVVALAVIRPDGTVHKAIIIRSIACIHPLLPSYLPPCFLKKKDMLAVKMARNLHII